MRPVARGLDTPDLFKTNGYTLTHKSLMDVFQCYFTDCIDKMEQSTMATFNDHTAAISFETLRQFGFYQLFESNTKKIFGWNVYQFSYITLIVITQCLIIFGNCGFLFELDDTINNIDLLLIIFSNSFNYLTVLKVFILMFNKSKIQQLLDVTDLNFFKSKQCRDNIKIFYKHRNKILQLSKLYFNFTVSVIIQWGFYPIIINSFIFNKTDNNRRLENIINRRYPVAVNTYNQYYALYYVIEAIIAVISLYLVAIIDILLLPVGWAIIVQNKILAISFKNIGQNVNLQNGETTFLSFYHFFKKYLGIRRASWLNVE